MFISVRYTYIHVTLDFEEFLMDYRSMNVIDWQGHFLGQRGQEWTGGRHMRSRATLPLLYPLPSVVNLKPIF